MEIRQASNELKEQITGYLEGCTEQIERSVAGMMSQREDLDATWQQISQDCQYESDSESIRTFDKTMKTIEAALESPKLEISKPDGCSLVDTGRPNLRVTKDSDLFSVKLVQLVILVLLYIVICTSTFKQTSYVL